MTSPEIGLHVTTATRAADAVDRCSDYRDKWAHLGVGAIHLGAALAIIFDRFVSVLEQSKEEKP